ncbi:MAG: hypothetical protein N2558_02370 [Patescibacteria group bacterium]|nr:hypothetical protein [Patescibacteria group bacterium]
MDQEHAIPQQISSYQFKLVGDMTIKQFFQVAGGTLVALILYSSGLPSYIKWPLMLFAFLLGIALAFFPVEDRPLSRWIILFFKSIYSPTLYEWQANYQKPYYFQDELPSYQAELQQFQNKEQEITQNTSSNDLEIQTNNQEIKQKTSYSWQAVLEKKEAAFLNKVDKHINENPLEAIQKDLSGVNKTEISIPQTQNVRIINQVKDQNSYVYEPKQIDRFTQNSEIKPILGEIIFQQTQTAKFSTETHPAFPTQPNTVVGQVITKDGKIIENAIIEIRDENGLPVRALKSNSLGHFAIITPLANGQYQILTEKENYKFEPITIILKGEILKPLIISPI